MGSLAFVISEDLRRSRNGSPGASGRDWAIMTGWTPVSSPSPSWKKPRPRRSWSTSCVPSPWLPGPSPRERRRSSSLSRWTKPWRSRLTTRTGWRSKTVRRRPGSTPSTRRACCGLSTSADGPSCRRPRRGRSAPSRSRRRRVCHGGGFGGLAYGPPRLRRALAARRDFDRDGLQGPFVSSRPSVRRTCGHGPSDRERPGHLHGCLAFASCALFRIRCRPWRHQGLSRASVARWRAMPAVSVFWTLLSTTTSMSSSGRYMLLAV